MNVMIHSCSPLIQGKDPLQIADPSIEGLAFVDPDSNARRRNPVEAVFITTLYEHRQSQKPKAKRLMVKTRFYSYALIVIGNSGFVHKQTWAKYVTLHNII